MHCSLRPSRSRDNRSIIELLHRKLLRIAKRKNKRERKERKKLLDVGGKAAAARTDTTKRLFLDLDMLKALFFHNVVTQTAARQALFYYQTSKLTQSTSPKPYQRAVVRPPEHSISNDSLLIARLKFYFLFFLAFSTRLTSTTTAHRETNTRVRRAYTYTYVKHEHKANE